MDPNEEVVVSQAAHDVLVSQARAAGRTEGLAEGAANLTASVAKALADGTAAGRAEGLKDGAAVERARMLGIDAIAVAGHDALIAACKADGSTPEQTAMKILEAEKATRGKVLTSIKSVETEAGKIAPAPNSVGAGNDVTPKATTPEGWKAEYASQDAGGAALRAEFTSAEAYVAFKSAESKGLVRRLVNRSA